MSSHYIGQRLSLKGQLCTVQFVGAVQNKSGEWLGVEWDDTARGKHNGTHEGVKYFECKSNSPTTASFLRPNQPWDKSRTFYQALHEKYMSDDASNLGATVYFSTKQAEEVGFQKFAKRQAALQGIHVLILDRMRIRHVSKNEDDAIRETCKDITELALSSNLFESLDEILNLIALLPKLSHLILDGNRFRVDTGSGAGDFPRVSSLSLSNTLLHQSGELLAPTVVRHFSRMKTLTIANDELQDTVSLSPADLPDTLISLDLANNNFTALTDLRELDSRTHLAKLNLEKCQIKSRGQIESPISSSVVEVDLAHNAINSWGVIDALPSAFPAMKQLRTTGNPIYKDIKSATGKPLMAEDGYMLTIARLPQLEMLNYSKITEKERLNAEKYYLNEITAELAGTAPEKRAEVLRRHSRWNALCEEYGEPSIPDQPKADSIDPRSLAARLVDVTFVITDHSDWQVKIPKSFNIYSVPGMVGKKLSVMPLELRLIWETGERDPIGLNQDQTGIEEWDSDEEGDGDDIKIGESSAAREVELVAGTRTLGTYIEGREARVRVERKS
ncbi:hypothetical protein CKM354_000419300 [Cercospora kikuchii]|uniref:CAP-Gly domain-containing protein n=1 Tax=Cercospora kikuchii TaxID=84275 RepID=A0A9P3CCT7_9PEZI|nr:uncharacterized protein CKM354_000419300 [Cercospora kikuchii]GIZ40872.1 hypothetical protein CKM354_000419300 [Cercospora kikuchii]